MKTTDAIKLIANMDRDGVYVFRAADLRILLGARSERTFLASIARLEETGFLERLSRGVYINPMSRHIGAGTLEKIATTLRRGHRSYLSLESALSEYGVISQIPVGRITVMTTGRSGTFETKYGAIEFVHTERGPAEILKRTKAVEGRALRLATPELALEDLKRVNRNLHLVSFGDFEEVAEDVSHEA